MGGGDTNFNEKVEARVLQVFNGPVGSVVCKTSGNDGSLIDYNQIIKSVNEEAFKALREIQQHQIENSICNLVKGDFNQAVKDLDVLLDSSGYEKLSTKQKRTLFHYRCVAQSILDESNLLPYLEKIKLIDEEFCELDLYLAWSDFVEYKRGRSTLKYIEALLKVPNIKPSIFEVALRSGDVGLYEVVKGELLCARFESGEELAGFGGVLYLLSGFCSVRGDYQDGLKALNYIDSTAESENMHRDLRKLILEIQVIVDDPLIFKNVHVSISQWREIYVKIEESERLVSLTRKVGDLTAEAEASSAKSLCWALLGKHAKAISSVPEKLYQELNGQAIMNYCMSLQSLGDWEGILRLLNNLENESYPYLRAVALMNLERPEEAASVPGLTKKELEKIRNPGAGENNELVSVDQKFARICRAYSEGNLSNVKEKICSIQVSSFEERVCKADALFFCNQNSLALDCYKDVFEEVGYGFGEAFGRFLKLLLDVNHRSLLKIIFEAIPEKMILDSNNLLVGYFSFMSETLTPAQFLEKLNSALGDRSDLFLRSSWIHYAARSLPLEEVEAAIEEWGSNIEGSVEERLDYYRVVGQVKGWGYVSESLYSEFQRYSFGLEFHQVVFSLAVLGLSSEVDLDMGTASEKCCVILERDNRQRDVLIDLHQSPNGLRRGLGKNDERAATLLGRKVGDLVEFEGEEYSVAKVWPHTAWLVRKSMEELKNQPVKSGVVCLRQESVDASVQQLLEMAEENRGRKREIFREAYNSPRFALTRIRSDNFTFVKNWCEFLSFEEGENIYLPGNELSLKEDSNVEFVLDGTSFSTISTMVDGVEEMFELGAKLRVPNSILSMFNGFDRKKFLMYGVLGNVDSSLSGEDLERNFWRFIGFLDGGEVGGIPPIPNSPFSFELSEVFSRIFVFDRDALYATYGHEGRVLVSDDVGMISLAKSLNVRCLSTFQLLSIFFDINGAAVSLFKSYLKIAKTNLCPRDVPGSLLSYIARNVDPNDVASVMERILPAVEYTRSNLEIFLGFYLSEILLVEQYAGSSLEKVIDWFFGKWFDSKGYMFIRSFLKIYLSGKFCVDSNHKYIFNILAKAKLDFAKYTPFSSLYTLQLIEREGLV